MLNNEAVSIKFIENLLHSTKSSAHVKDIISGKYVDSNLINVKKFGLTKPEEIIGCTIYDLNNFMEKYWGNKLVREIECIENKVIANQECIKDKRAFLSADGKVWIHDMTKIPLINSKGLVFNIFTISDNITSQCDLFKLWEFYSQFYNTNTLKKYAIEKYMEHINIALWFTEMPTESELKVLIAKTKAPASKSIANILHLSPRTVHSHLEKLREKAKLSLGDIVSMIRIIE